MAAELPEPGRFRRFRRRLSTILFLGFMLVPSAAGAQEAGDDAMSDTPLWRRALAGAIDAYPAQGPNGDIYVVADDRALHSLDPETGKLNWIYRPGGRLRNLLMVAPDGTIYVQNDRQELYAVTPGGTGRWKLNMQQEPSALPAASPDGRLIVPLTGGRIVGVSRHGRILWTRDEIAEASAGPVVDSEGIAWVPLSDGRIVALDYYGEPVAEADAGGPVSVAALDGLGRIWAGGYYGRISVFDTRLPEGEAGEVPSLEPLFVLRPGSSRTVSILTGPDGDALIFQADGTTLEVGTGGEELSRRSLAVSGGAASAAADGTLFLPAADGSIRVLDTEGQETVLRASSVLAEPLLTQEGILVSGGGDWILYAWEALPPGPGWRQFRGDSRRSGTFPMPAPILDRREARRDAGFFYREKMALSNDISERMSLIRELESYPDSQSMHKDLPWVDLLLEDLAEVGTTRVVSPYDEPLQSQPLVRARAYTLLAESEDFRTRSILLSCLAKEEDQLALAAGFRALGYIGVDWDGASLRMMADRFRRSSPASERLVVETARALADLVRYNGDLSDPSGYDLMNNLLKSPVSESARNEVIAIIRSVASL